MRSRVSKIVSYTPFPAAIMESHKLEIWWLVYLLIRYVRPTIKEDESRETNRWEYWVSSFIVGGKGSIHLPTTRFLVPPPKAANENKKSILCCKVCEFIGESIVNISRSGEYISPFLIVLGKGDVKWSATSSFSSQWLAALIGIPKLCYSYVELTEAGIELNVIFYFNLLSTKYMIDG